MCTSYQAGKDINLQGIFEVDPPPGEWRDEIYKDYAAPIILHANGTRQSRLATFGIVPRKHIPPGVKVFDTMNARAESVGEKRSFSSGWKQQQLCLIPCTSFYEPNYETGKAVRWRIGIASDLPFAIAGLWREWDEPEGPALAFTMLTVNADEHSLMKRFHKPGEEKRSVVIVRPQDYDDWLGSRTTDEARSFLSLYPANLMRADAHPLPPRKPAAAIVDDGQQPSLPG